MPTYEYRCAKCGKHVEVYQSFSEAPLTKHEGCGGKLTKVLSPAGIVLKGSGFYKTDSRSASKGKTATKAKETADTSSASSSDTSGSSKESKASSKESSGTGSSSGDTAKSA
jgi:putative FmdB family regulatory protein